MLIAYVGLALGVSFICSLLEAILLSTSLSHISILERDGKKSGSTWANLKSDDAIKPLTAILTLNTIAHTMGAAGVGSEVQSEYGDEWLTFASVILTIAVLFLSEIIPKTIGAAYWKQLSTPAAQCLRFMTWSMWVLIAPIVWMKKRLPSSENSVVTRDELAILADIGEEEGELEEDEETVIHNLLRLREVPVKDVMTPRVVVKSYPVDWTIAQVLEESPVLIFSRIPVHKGTLDEVCGMVLRSQILTAASNDRWNLSLEELMKPINCINSEDSVDKTLDLFLSTRQQIAMVLDEFGGTSGIVTMEDVIETLLGEEIVDELDEVEDMRELAREQAGGEE